MDVGTLLALIIPIIGQTIAGIKYLVALSERQQLCFEKLDELSTEMKELAALLTRVESLEEKFEKLQERVLTLEIKVLA